MVGRLVDDAVVDSFLGPGVQTAGEKYRLALRVLGMGDCNACDLAQATHEGILKPAGLLRQDKHLKCGRAAPRDDIWEGCY